MTTLLILLIVACILATGFYAGAEMGFYRLNRVRLALRLRDRVRGARVLDSLVRRPDEFVVMTIVGQNVFVFLATFICTELYEPAWAERAEFLATLTLIVPIFIFGEVLQKEIFARSADTLMYRLSGPLSLSARVLGPLVFVLVQVQRLWGRFRRGRETSLGEVEVERHRLFHFFRESAQEGTLSVYQHVMAANIMRLQGMGVDRVMMPLESVVTLRANATLDECRDIARITHYRRFPVIDETDAPVGVVNMLDIIAGAHEELFDVRRHLRRPLVFSRESTVIDTLHRLKHSGKPMGFVEDARGAIIGIITIKDLVEQITGEISTW